jgi:hypothetical protein
VKLVQIQSASGSRQFLHGRERRSSIKFEIPREFDGCKVPEVVFTNEVMLKRNISKGDVNGCAGEGRSGPS